MGRNTSVPSGDYFEEFSNAKIYQEKFKSDTKLIRVDCGCRMMRKNKIVFLQKALQAGVESGIAKNFNPHRYLTALRNKKRVRG